MRHIILSFVPLGSFSASSVKSSKHYPLWFLNVILFSLLFTYILIEEISITVSCFLMIYSKESWLSDAEYDPSDNSNSSFHVWAYIINLIIFVWHFFIFPCIVNAKVC